MASLFPFVGTIIYMILRPPEYLEDVRERELETQAAEARLRQLDQTLCPHCDYRVERDFIRCPSCLRKLKERCASCSRPLDQAWTICPYCEADVPGLSAPRSGAGVAGVGRALRGASRRRELELTPAAAAEAPSAAAGGAGAGAAEPAAAGPAAGARASRPGGRTRPSS